MQFSSSNFTAYTVSGIERIILISKNKNKKSCSSLLLFFFLGQITNAWKDDVRTDTERRIRVLPFLLLLQDPMLLSGIRRQGRVGFQFFDPSPSIQKRSSSDVSLCHFTKTCEIGVSSVAEEEAGRVFLS